MSEGGRQPRAYLTTRDAARIVGCATWEIRYAISIGRLEAERILPPTLPGRQSAKPIIRIYPEPFLAYLRAYWPRVEWQPCSTVNTSQPSV